MARPPVEWPIPTYVVEYRERILLAFRVPGRVLAAVAPPIVPELSGGVALVALSLANGRCLKTVGGTPVLAAEFHTAELLTPVRWQGACRPAQRGLFLLRFLSGSHGLCRLVRTALRCDAEPSTVGQDTERDGTRYRVVARDGSPLQCEAPRGRDVVPWSESSVFPTQDSAEEAFVHPEWVFAADRREPIVRAVPVHHYARSTSPFTPAELDTSLISGFLGIQPSEMSLDHALMQKRCTHTWMFPPERIVTARVPVASPLLRSGGFSVRFGGPAPARRVAAEYAQR